MESLARWKSLLSEHSSAYKAELERRESEVRAFVEWDLSRRPLAQGALPIAVKDNIAVAGYKLTCGSAMLADFRCPYDATIVERAVAAGFHPTGKTNLDEFGMGSSTDNSAAGSTNNPWDLERVAGGSSGGSAAAVATGMVPLAFGTDTGGSVRQPASFCGVYGFKPTYGALSRYGLVAYASSLEVAGILADSVDGLASLYAACKGKDPMDQTSTERPPNASEESSRRADESGRPIRKIGVLTGDLGLDQSTAAGYKRMQEAARACGFELTEVTIPSFEHLVPVYYIIASAEASANLARFNGVRYGSRPLFAENPEQLVQSSRGQGFGTEVKLRILLGTYVLRSGFQDQYYQRAQRVRTKIRNELAELFTSVDALLSPVFPTVAFKHGQTELDAFQQKVADRFTTLANLAAIPALSVPAGVHGGLPVGVQIMGPQFADEELFAFARAVSREIPFERPPRYPESIATQVTGGGEA